MAGGYAKGRFRPSSYNANTGAGGDGCHPRVPLDLSAETCGRLAVFLAKVMQCGCWPGVGQHASLLSCSKECPKNVTTERTVALLPSMVGVVESASGPRMKEMNQYGRKQWRSRERTAWEAMLDMEKHTHRRVRLLIVSGLKKCGVQLLRRAIFEKGDSRVQLIRLAQKMRLKVEHCRNVTFSDESSKKTLRVPFVTSLHVEAKHNRGT